MFLSVLSLVVNQKFLNMMKTVKISDLKLEEDLKENSPQQIKYKEFLSLFKDTDIRTAIDVLEAMQKIIDRALKLENDSKKLQDIKLPYITNEKDN